MIRVISSLFAVLFLLTAVPSAMAQRGNNVSPEQMRERMLAQVDETVTALELKGDRAESVKAILVAQGEKRMAIQTEMRGARGNGQGGNMQAAMTAMRERMVAIDTETTTMLAEVLTEDEMVKYTEIAASRQRGPRGARGARVN